MSKPKRISELPLTTNPSISDLVPLASNGSNNRVTIGTILNNGFATTLGDTTINGDLTINGTETIISSSVLYDSGSTIFGDSVDDKHDFIGDVHITGSIFVSSSVTATTYYGDGSNLTGITAGTNGTSGINGTNGTSGINGTSGLLSLTGTTNNGLITLDGSAPNGNVESNLTFDGSTLNVSGDIVVTGDYTINGNSFSSSLFQSSSISGSVIEFTKGDKTTETIKIPDGLGYSGLGWARYDDTTYTTSSPLTITDGSDVVLPCNGSGSIETHIHSSVSFYNPNGQKIQAENEGDVYVLTIDFSLRAVTNPSFGDYVRIQMNNTTGTPYTRVGRDLFFAKNDNSWHKFHEVFQYYSDSDFVANGNEINIIPSGFNVQVADVIIFIQRTQNHSQH